MKTNNHPKKTCSKCKTLKDTSEYHIKKSAKSGRASECRTCNALMSKEYSRTKKGVLSTIYASQRHSSKQREHTMPTYTKRELQKWVFDQLSFHKLYNNWKNSGYHSSLKPSLDRKDDYLPYSFGNIQLMTWGENKNKGHTDRRNGVNNKVNKAVIQYSIKGKFISKFYSIGEASRITGINDGNIIKNCKGIYKTANGFIWKYV